MVSKGNRKPDILTYKTTKRHVDSIASRSIGSYYYPTYLCIIVHSASTQYLIQAVQIPRHEVKPVAPWSHHQISRISTSRKRISINPMDSLDLERRDCPGQRHIYIVVRKVMPRTHPVAQSKSEERQVWVLEPPFRTKDFRVLVY